MRLQGLAWLCDVAGLDPSGKLSAVDPQVTALVTPTRQALVKPNADGTDRDLQFLSQFTQRVPHRQQAGGTYNDEVR
jgi:hypothetical protein